MYWFLAHPSSGDLTPLHSTLPCHSIEPCHLYSVDAIMPGLPYNWQPTCAKFLCKTTSLHSVMHYWMGRHLGRARHTIHSTKFWQSSWAEVFHDTLRTILHCLQWFCRIAHSVQAAFAKLHFNFLLFKNSFIYQNQTINPLKKSSKCL